MPDSSRSARDVVHDVEEDRESLGVAAVDEAFEAVGPPVGVVRSIEVDAIVAPAVTTGELRHRHQLDVRHAQGHQMVEARDGAVERASERERADVELVDEPGPERGRPPLPVRPQELGMVHESGRAVNSRRLPGRSWIWHPTAVDDEGVRTPGSSLGVDLPPIARPGSHRPAPAEGFQLDGLSAGRPDTPGTRISHATIVARALDRR